MRGGFGEKQQSASLKQSAKDFSTTSTRPCRLAHVSLNAALHVLSCQAVTCIMQTCSSSLASDLHTHMKNFGFHWPLGHKVVELLRGWGRARSCLGLGL